MNIALWVVQGLLALAFLLAGAMKSFAPLENLKKNMAWTGQVPVGLVRFIGIAELLGGIGLILPAVTHILPWLTATAAVGLVLVMIGAAIYHASHKEWSSIGVNVVLLLLALFIVLGRVMWSPL
jgi:uncharacterized membrane protein